MPNTQHTWPTNARISRAVTKTQTLNKTTLNGRLGKQPLSTNQRIRIKKTRSRQKASLMCLSTEHARRFAKNPVRRSVTGQYGPKLLIGREITLCLHRNTTGPNRTLWQPPKRYFELEQGRYCPVFPKTPANHSFTIIAKVKPGREDAIREHGEAIEKAIKAWLFPRRDAFQISALPFLVVAEDLLEVSSVLVVGPQFRKAVRLHEIVNFRLDSSF